MNGPVDMAERHEIEKFSSSYIEKLGLKYGATRFCILRKSLRPKICFVIVFSNSKINKFLFV